MNDKLQARLEQLRKEQAAGIEALNEIERKRDELRTTLLRISGAIQVIEELLAEPSQAPTDEPAA
nr:hypothetical protein [uncultured Rhodopila sp.]